MTRRYPSPSEDPRPTVKEYIDLEIRARIGDLAEQLQEHRHIIEVRDDGWTIAHPLVERLDLDTLFGCSMRGPDDDPGVRGRFWLTPDGQLGAPI